MIADNYFNSIKVRLELSDDKLYVGMVNNFNSIKVRLERSRREDKSIEPEFQFHKGAIRTPRRTMEQGGAADFNSIKVRLERRSVICSGLLLEFQFHKGAIRTLLPA